MLSLDKALTLNHQILEISNIQCSYEGPESGLFQELRFLATALMQELNTNAIVLQQYQTQTFQHKPMIGAMRDHSPPSISPDNAPYADVIQRKRRMRASLILKSGGARICAWCKTSESPEWRKGPSKEFLCNACGLQFRKLKKQGKDMPSSAPATPIVSSPSSASPPQVSSPEHVPSSPYINKASVSALIN